jgi:sulfofructose kinase
MSDFDVLGIGLNATDTLILLPRFPAYAGKEPFRKEILSPGGQVATAIAACAGLGLRAKYIGAVGDDLRGEVQIESLRSSGIDIADVVVRKGCPNQTAYILIDETTGERTVLWHRADCLRLHPEEIPEAAVASARLVHIDGHDTAAVAHAARIARRLGIPVTVDVDTVYAGFEDVLPNVDFLVASSEFPGRFTNLEDPFAALERLQRDFGIRCAAMTLGAHGSMALCGGRYFYSPAFVVNCVDTTGAGDAFHGAFCYGVLNGWTIAEILTFSNALAALNCTALGARGHLGTLEEAKELASRAERRVHRDFEKWRV